MVSLNRRTFLKSSLATFGVIRATMAGESEVQAGQPPQQKAGVGCIVDTTLCIGCRQCEEACNRRNNLPRPPESFRSRAIFRQHNRPTATAFTVVNEYRDPPSADQTEKRYTYVKTQCMHCLDPACVSACIVGALSKAEDGSVVYNPAICIGCRYCLIACPFQVPAYEFNDPITPRVRKCEFCTDRAAGMGANPACAAACPTEALVFGRRDQLLDLARDRIMKFPDRYEKEIYGEYEGGGTRWLYLVGRPHDEIGLLELPGEAPPDLTEAIQHGIFRYAAIPIAVYGILGGVMWLSRRYQQEKDEKSSAEEVKSQKGDER